MLLKDHSPAFIKVEMLADTVQKLSLARNKNEIIQIVRTVARKLTGADGATFVLRDGNLCYYAEEDAISPLWKGSRFPMESCDSGWVILNKSSAVIEDIYSDERIAVDAYRPTFVKSMVMVPVRRMDPLGAIGNYWAQPHQPTPEEVSVLQALADITAVSIDNIEVRNKLEEKLNEQMQMLNQLTEQKKQLEEFMHIIAHNLRAPLSNLLLLAELIEKTSNVEEKLNYLEKQKPVIDFLHKSFEELVNAIYVKTGFTVECNHIELEPCFRKVINLLEGEILQTEATLHIDFSKAKTVYFPQKYMENIVLNLLSNALKYRSPDRKPEINITSYKENEWTWLQIRDNGLGIDMEKNKDKLFKLGQTFHGYPNSNGFGLFMVKTQLEALGGDIQLKSTPGTGSTFTIKLNKCR